MTASAMRAAGWSVLGFACCGLAGGVLWASVTRPARYRVTTDGAFLDERSLGAVFAADGWFLVVGLVAGMVAGCALGFGFRRHGPLTVLAILAGAGIASLLAYLVGHALGPDALTPRLRAASPGDQVPVPLTVAASGAYLGWPVGAMVGALGASWAWDRNEPGASARVLEHRSPTVTAATRDQPVL